MSAPNSVVLLPNAKDPKKPAAARPPFSRPGSRIWRVALAIALGWTVGFFQGRHAIPKPPAVEAAPIEPVPAPAMNPPTARKSFPNPTTAGSALAEPSPAPLPAGVGESLSAPPAAAVPASAAPPATPTPVSAPQSRRPVPAPAPEGAVHLTSKPDKANVFSGDKLLGQTPLLLEHLTEGTHSFRVEKERHTRKLAEIRVWGGRQTELEVELQYDPEPRTGTPFTNSQDVRMEWIPALQGWVAAVETTQKVYEALTHENPSDHRGPDLPVTNVTWANATRFCELLTIAERGSGFLPAGYAYTLPSDAEWSLLAAGTPLSQAVTSKTGARQQPAPAGSLAPNKFGLYDIRGNVWEWCRDSYTGEVHRRELVENATGDPTRINQRYKILRGGSWNRSLDTNLAIGYRLVIESASQSDYETGLRVALLKAQP